MSYPFSGNFNQSNQNQSNQNQNNQLVELNSNHVLQNSEVFQKVGEHVRSLKSKSMNIHKNISDEVEKGTVSEKKELETAINNYQNKVNSILERDDIKQSVKTGEQYGDQLDKVMTQIKTAYIQSIQEIKSNCKDQNEFLEKVQELDNRIENVLLTDEEKEMIQKVREEINTMFGGEEATAMIKYLPF
jgi:hypothetical protein